MLNPFIITMLTNIFQIIIFKLAATKFSLPFSHKMPGMVCDDLTTTRLKLFRLYPPLLLHVEIITLLEPRRILD